MFNSVWVTWAVVDFSQQLVTNWTSFVIQFFDQEDFTREGINFEKFSSVVKSAEKFS